MAGSCVEQKALGDGTRETFAPLVRVLSHEGWDQS